MLGLWICKEKRSAHAAPPSDNILVSNAPAVGSIDDHTGPVGEFANHAGFFVEGFENFESVTIRVRYPFDGLEVSANARHQRARPLKCQSDDAQTGGLGSLANALASLVPSVPSISNIHIGGAIYVMPKTASSSTMFD